MRYVKVLQIFSIVIILSLLVIAVPATAQTRFITLVPDEGTIGSTVTIAGEGFNKSTETTDKYAVIYFSSQEATTIDDIDDDVTIYEIVKDGLWLDENGEFEETFTVPDELDDGATDRDVTSGTYYLYVCHYLSITPPTIAKDIRAIAEFTVIGGQITLDPDEGPVATEVEITGAEFSSRDDIIIEYDGDEVDLEGDDETDSYGEFVSFILIPESTAGIHTITITVSGSEVETEFTVEPEVILSPTSGEADTTVTVSGAGFGRREEVTIYFNNTGLATATADGQGSFDFTFSVPELEAGIYTLEAEDDDENLDTAKFTITVPSPPTPSPTPSPAPSPSPTTASISSSSGHVGKNIVIGGAGFEAGGIIIVKYDGEEVAAATAGSDGMFMATFRVPVSEYGSHIVTVSDGTNTEQFTFTVESTPPPAPAPLVPEMGVEVKPPIAFDWKNVVDDSPPVTYTFQIATTEDFSADSIVLEKKGLTTSIYSVTEKDQEDLVGQEAPYYWRVRAVDGASNEGEWTGAGQFYIAPPFSMPSWVIYTLIGLGGLVLFAVGYWLGRRTAYYY